MSDGRGLPNVAVENGIRWIGVVTDNSAYVKSCFVQKEEQKQNVVIKKLMILTSSVVLG